ncbi:sigma-70 family RNA polymerase sigma factor [Mesobacillus zeae]|uniref:Sigma-70 family RNA polymerase sigma factor n=1 Tax=Mesobacillus zeae TaxID=1917180 RepID=A0A398AZ80_9BACI|nr:sigma-70 family RNA polymerase sigma factor [Mesobacillus zeae]RID82917.1 sigma-70 family RNA polymerase sigma factor [Mesobacillus zeae]
MDKWDPECRDKVEQFKHSNKDFLSNPLIKEFLADEEHYELFTEAVCSPCDEVQERINEKFKEFYFRIRFISYVSSTLYFHGINLDKKIRKHDQRFPLQLDQPINNESETTLKELIEYKENDSIDSGDVLDFISDPVLYKAIKSLTNNQQDILSLAYVKGLKDVEIAALLKKTQQAVSKSRKKALNTLKSILLKSDEEKEL